MLQFLQRITPHGPSRLLSAFPPGVSVERTGLKQAVETVRAFMTREA